MNKKELRKILAENLRVERARRKYSQEILAEKADIGHIYLTKIENEQYNPTIFVVAKLALALGVTIDTLLPLDKFRK